MPIKVQTHEYFERSDEMHDTFDTMHALQAHPVAANLKTGLMSQLTRIIEPLQGDWSAAQRDSPMPRCLP